MSINSYSWNRPDKITMPGGSTLNYSYSGFQETTAIVSRDPAGNVGINYGYTHNLAGNVTAKNTEHGNYNYDYDKLYRLIKAENPGSIESYSHDGLGNRLSSTGSSDWSYNDNNQLSSYGDRSFTYDNHSNMTTRVIAGQTTSFNYTVDNRLQQVEDNNGTTIGSYAYDPFGRRLWKEVSGTTTYFHYNDEGLVGEYDASGSELRTYGYHQSIGDRPQ